MNSWWDEMRKLQQQEIKLELHLTDEASQMLRDSIQPQVQELMRRVHLNRALHHSHDEHMQRVIRGFNPHDN